MLGRMSVFALAALLVLAGPAGAGSGDPPPAAQTPVSLQLPVPTQGDAAPDSWISGKWYHAVSCPAWSGRYIFHIRWRPGGMLEGSSTGISFGAQGHSSEIVSGKIDAGAFEFTERSDKGFIASYRGRIGPDGLVLSGTYRNTRSDISCRFVMERFES